MNVWIEDYEGITLMEQDREVIQNTRSRVKTKSKLANFMK